jgi:hypothetical protein
VLHLQVVVVTGESVELFVDGECLDLHGFESRVLR